MVSGRRPRIVFIFEGGRSRADVAALTAVAAALEQAGATVTVLRHGLGRLSARTVRRELSAKDPDVVVTTGPNSNRDAERMSRRAGLPLVCYYWPAGPVEDIHRRPRHSHTPRRARKLSPPTHAVVGSPLQREELLKHLPAQAAVTIHILPPLLDKALFDQGGERPRRPRAASLLPIGVFGGHGRDLPSLERCRYINLDAAPLGQAPLEGCAGVLLLGGDAVDEREAPHRCAVALASGHPVLASGFGASGEEPPLSLKELMAKDPVPLLVVPPAALPAAISVWAEELRLRSEASVFPLPGVQAALSPERVLEQHVSLLLQIAKEGRPPAPRRTDSVAARLLSRLRRLLRR